VAAQFVASREVLSSTELVRSVYLSVRDKCIVNLTCVFVCCIVAVW
jgi:hypothetical protein